MDIIMCDEVKDTHNHSTTNQAAVEEPENTQHGVDQGLVNQLETCEKELAQWKDKSFRATADLVNYQKRMEKEQLMWRRSAHVELLTPLLAIVDDFDRAVKAHQSQESQHKNGIDGFDLIRRSLEKYLYSVGVEAMACEGTPFDPELHEALVRVENSGKPEGTVIEVLQKGYMFKDTVLRHAKVTVAA